MDHYLSSPRKTVNDFYKDDLHRNSAIGLNQETQQLKIKPSAFINPQIINCKQIKVRLGQNSLTRTNKIHLNPNFKRIRVPDDCTHNAKLEQVPFSFVGTGTSFSTNTNNEGVASRSTTTAPSDTKQFQLLSHYKLIKTESQKPECNHLKYSWHKECTEEEFLLNKQQQQKNQSSTKKFLGINAQPQTKYNRTENHSFIRSRNQFKLIIPKNKISTLDSKSQLCETKSHQIYVSKTKVINVQSKKVNNNPLPMVNQERNQLKHSPNKTCSTYSNYNYNKFKKSNTGIMVPPIVHNKYKSHKGVMCQKMSRYRIDKRKKCIHKEIYRKKFILSKTSDIGKLFPEYLKRKYINHNSKFTCSYNKYIKKKSSLSWRKNQVTDRIEANKANHCLTKRIVKIGGIFYKSTSKKLAITKQDRKALGNSQSNKLHLNKKKARKNHVVYVRGEKFLLDKNGKTLIKDSSSLEKNQCTAMFSRVDIGGVTYLQKSQNVLIRTNVHHARQIVTHAKHKSIATLSKLKKRSILPCLIYYKFGKCARHSKGLCMYKHDPKNVALCRKFLKGNCIDNNCLLSHEAIQEKMATCHFFLSGCCTRDKCPFLHVKINDNADICENFLHGFCDLGEECEKRHLFQCPKFEKYGKCSLGKKCPYPHKPKNSTSLSETNQILDKPPQYVTQQLPANTKNENQGDKRPILKLRIHNASEVENNGKESESTSPTLTSTSPELEFVPKRVKLDILPAYIPLKLEK